MSFKQKAFLLHLVAVSVPMLCTALVPVLQATGNPLALSGALLLTSLASYHWGSVSADGKPAPEKDTPKALLEEAVEAFIPEKQKPVAEAPKAS